MFQEMVVAHGMQSPNDRLSEAELIASTNASLKGAALEYAAGWQGGARGEDVEAGATPQSHEVFLTLQYAPFPR